MLHYGFEVGQMGRKSEIHESEAAFRRKNCVTFDWKGSMPSLLIYTVLI